MLSIPMRCSLVHICMDGELLRVVRRQTPLFRDKILQGREDLIGLLDAGVSDVEEVLVWDPHDLQ